VPAQRSQTVQRLLRELRRFEDGQRAVTQAESSLSTGISALDAVLPAQGLRAGTLIEWMATESASGMGTLVFSIASRLRNESGVCVVIDGSEAVYPLAISRLGVDLDTVIVVRPSRVQEVLWAIGIPYAGAGSNWPPLVAEPASVIGVVSWSVVLMRVTFLLRRKRRYVARSLVLRWSR